MQAVYFGVVGLVMLAMVSGQDTFNREVAEGLNRSVKHIILDVRGFFAIHKELQARLPDGSSKLRHELDEMWNLIKCIIELHKNMSAMIDQLEEVGFPDDIIQDLIGRWLQIIFEKTSKLADLANRIRRAFDEGLIQRFDELNANCIEESTSNLLDVLEVVAARAEARVDALLALQWNKPIPDICKKIREMISLCKEMRLAWRKIRNELKTTCQLTFHKYPYKEMGLMCDCIIEFCKIIRQLNHLCHLATTTRISPAELEKRLCQLIMDLIDVRTRLIDYYVALEKVVQKSVKKFTGNGKLAKRCQRFVRTALFGLIQKMDACVRKLQCLYQDLVNAGGPRRTSIAVPIGPADSAVKEATKLSSG